MAYKLIKTALISFSVTVNIATEKAGVSRQETFGVEADKLKQSELKALLDEIQDGDASNADIIDRHFRKFTDVLDEAGNPVDFDVAREAIKEDIAASNEAVAAYVRALHGAKAKNSKRSR